MGGNKAGHVIVRKKPRKRPKALNLDAAHIDDGNMSSENAENTPFVRRTITVAPKINKWIQHLRAKSMLKDQELDFTTVMNYLAAYGIVFLETYERDDTDEQKANELIGERMQLQEQGFIDLYEDLFAHGDTEIEKQKASTKS